MAVSRMVFLQSCSFPPCPHGANPLRGFIQSATVSIFILPAGSRSYNPGERFLLGKLINSKFVIRTIGMIRKLLRTVNRFFCRLESNLAFGVSDGRMVQVVQIAEFVDIIKRACKFTIQANDLFT